MITAVRSYAELYARAKELLPEPGRLTDELDRVLAGAERELGPRLEETVRLAEMGLVARLDAWWTGPPQPNVRRAIEKAPGQLHDPRVLALALRLAAGYARLGRVDDQAHRLAVLARRLRDTGLGHPDEELAAEAARHAESALFLLSPGYAYALVRDLTPEATCDEARAHLARGNAPLAAELIEMRLARELDPWILGPSLPHVEEALRRWRAEQPAGLQELAVLLARAYVKGGFVDLRAKDHVLAVLQADTAQLLGPEEAIGFQEFVDRDCFDYPYSHCYEQVKASDPEALRAQVARHVEHGALTTAQRLCEMALVRRLADWWVGDPGPNVRAALLRWLETGPGQDDDADRCAHVLAGLYLATLQGKNAARSLVAAVAGRADPPPEFRDALVAAGIPPDVSVAELHQLYRDVTEIGARVEAFRARAEGQGGLTPYERTAYAEVLEFLEEEERLGLAEVTRTLGELAESVAPDGLVTSVAGAIESSLRLALSGAERLVRRERILGELLRKDPALRSLERLRSAKLELLDEVAWSITRENRIAAALEGLGCGLGGPTLLLVDLPMLVLVNLHAVAGVATVYGFDPESEEEREFILALLAGGREALRQLVAVEREAEEPEGPLAEVLRRHLTGNAALAVHAAAGRMAAQLVRQKLLQVIPILGGAVGAGLNFRYTQLTSRTAVMAYRLRWLLRRFDPGGASALGRAPGRG